jgi:ABC-type transporter Mla subunit MlaD
MAAMPHDLEDTLAAVEGGLASLAEALRARDAAAIDHHADALHRALSQAVQRFTAAAQQGPVEPALRRRLASASGLVAAQRESLARATAALDRAIDVLMPRDAPALYAASGARERTSWGNALRA